MVPLPRWGRIYRPIDALIPAVPPPSTQQVGPRNKARRIAAQELRRQRNIHRRAHAAYRRRIEQSLRAAGVGDFRLAHGRRNHARRNADNPRA